ncbi:unnamed protein product [Cuscuta campestris]|uniref:Aminoacyl-tRNA synthetase class II (D/K/N) domain-containing protein n=1 Tax=Cuscuta campestris TaxID=132261 RepID=A0A484N6S9_9ASTE|nr:unnamed protein product [Cuscuta campestris]
MCPTEATGVMTPPCTHNSKFTHRMILKTILEHSDGGMGLIGQKAVIGGWVTFSREWRKPISSPDELDPHVPIFSVLQVNDGSSPKRLQVLVDSRLESPGKVMPTGTCILVEGILQKASLQGGRQVQEIELVATEVLNLGTVEKNDNPLAKRCMPLQLLRDYPHLRTRTEPMGSVRRLHDSAFRALTAFFQDNGFLHVQLPVIHSSHNGFTYGKFQVIVAENKDTNNKRDDEEKEDVGVSNCKCNEENNDNNNNKDMKEGDDEHNSSQAEDKGKELVGDSDNNAQDDIINHVVTKDFFPDEPVYLTAHARLHLESQACALGNVYTYGPRFQAHKWTALMTSVEMWMVEAQMAFTRMEDVMDCAYDLLKFICKWVVDKSIEDVKHLSKPTGTTFVGWLQSITTRPFKKLSYDKAILVLNTILTENEYPYPTLKWGHPILDGYAKFLVSTVYKRPVIIYDHPKQVKPFYVRLNDDAKTVASFDIYFEGGNVVNGYQSEERLDVLIARIEELGVSKKEYEWYLDLCRHGNTSNNSGFTLMLDALVLSLCGFNDVRDVVPFPQCPKAN